MSCAGAKGAASEVANGAAAIRAARSLSRVCMDAPFRDCHRRRCAVAAFRCLPRRLGALIGKRRNPRPVDGDCVTDGKPVLGFSAANLLVLARWRSYLFQLPISPASNSNLAAFGSRTPESLASTL